MREQDGRTRIFTLLLRLAVLAWATWVSADPPARVARRGYVSDTVSFCPPAGNEFVVESGHVDVYGEGVL